MTVDPLTTAGLVDREVRTDSRDDTPTRIVIARRTYATDQADLWNAVTDPERLPRWFLPVSGELRLGGRYQFEGNAGGTVERCDEPEHFAVTWEYGDQVSWLRVTLSPLPTVRPSSWPTRHRSTQSSGRSTDRVLRGSAGISG